MIITTIITALLHIIKLLWLFVRLYYIWSVCYRSFKMLWIWHSNQKLYIGSLTGCLSGHPKKQPELFFSYKTRKLPTPLQWIQTASLDPFDCLAIFYHQLHEHRKHIKYNILSHAMLNASLSPVSFKYNCATVVIKYCSRSLCCWCWLSLLIVVDCYSLVGSGCFLCCPYRWFIVVCLWQL